ncbi:MAG: hypothetical protein CVU10_03620 [Bacteroidetes bacterium HGW-Bacteroidetes-5]|nr:MAG: hypothetical protein CVU10_03620 [Bacteroidetes bacterium HGW-Bacteroidetes-5]
MNYKTIKINKMNKVIVSLIILLLTSCGSKRYTYNDSIIIKSTKEFQSLDLKKINGLIQNIKKEEFRDKLLAQFPDALTDYTGKISVIVMLQMNYDNSKEKQANQIVSYYKELVTAELNRNGIITGN